jgi:hypothetical protein
VRAPCILRPVLRAFHLQRPPVRVTFQSAEGLANNLLSAKQKTRPEHKARVKRVMDALAKANLEQADLDWAAPS